MSDFRRLKLLAVNLIDKYDSFFKPDGDAFSPHRFVFTRRLRYSCTFSIGFPGRR